MATSIKIIYLKHYTKPIYTASIVVYDMIDTVHNKLSKIYCNLSSCMIKEKWRWSNRESKQQVGNIINTDSAGQKIQKR